ncbi:MAG TPA: FAD-linked oxidase C-terminal domain-containing protein [Anaerolineales bacterium]
MLPDSDFINELQKRIRGSVRSDRASRLLYSTDASIYQIEPLGVAIPRDQDDLQAIVELAARFGVPVIARGSGSGLAGQAIGAGLIVDCSRWLDAICEINPEARTATVEPGVILAGLNKALARYGLQFGPDPASAERATLGGVIANNATGAHSILYGMTADHLLSADVILSDGSAATWGEIPMDAARALPGCTGEIASSVLKIRDDYTAAIRQEYPRSWRNSAGYRLNYLLPWSPAAPPQWQGGHEGGGIGYPPVRPSTLNLAPLLAGSEGTLAVIRRATVNLVPRPKFTALAVLAYADIAAACDDVPRLLTLGPSAIELIPQSIVRLAQSVPAYAAQAALLAMPADALLAVEFSGNEAAGPLEAARALKPAVLAESAADQARVWSVRKVGLGLLASRAGDAKTVAFIEDCAIPVERLGAFVRGLEVILGEHGVQAEYYAHASAGCLHVRPILDLKRQVPLMRSIAEATLQLTLSLGGSMSSEHGDGLARSEWLRRTYGEDVLDAMRSLKQAADPRRILNPGKILDAPPMDANLRFGTEYQAQGWQTSLDFSHEGGLQGAIEQCNGQGVCRKFEGTMCPSFQASREEMHSTRGRANLLRALISGLAAPGAPASDRRGPAWEDAHGALDLCLACKGCKSECPSGVDMAKLKYAFQAEYYRGRIRPLRDYLFGYFHTVSALMSPVAPLANAFMHFGPTRSLIARLTGITQARPFPRYSSTPTRPRPGGATPVLFLSDSFTHYIEPDIEQAAFDVLSRLDYEVIVLPVIGAGASLLSKGFIGPARRHAARVLDAVRKLDPLGVRQIVGLEPPEVYTLKNDYGSLLPARAAELASLSRRTWLLDEFLVRSDRFEALQQMANAPGVTQAVQFQPHCHQRAEPPSPDGLPTGAGATMHLLRSCGFQVDLIDSGCCGMAGTFGYEAEHYDLSMKVGALKLFPAIEAAHESMPGLVVAATGTACRLQVAQGTQARTEHPINLIARCLETQ